MSAARKITIENFNVLTLKEVMTLTKYSRNSLDRFDRTGVLKKQKGDNGKPVYREKDVIEFMINHMGINPK